MTDNYDAILKDVHFNTTWGGKSLMWGRVFEDTKNRFQDGELIHTSLVKNLEGNIIQTRNTRYRIVSFSGEINDWVEENEIDIETEEGQLAIKLRWF